MEDKKLNRREFIKTAAGAGLASAIASGMVLAAAIDANNPADPNKPDKAKEKYPQVPMRKFGRFDKLVPALSLGMMFDTVENQIVLHKAYQWGVNFWDTANNYGGGKSEEGIGKFLAKYPNRRKDLFIASKASGARTSQERDERLKTSFERMNTDYVDLYHGVHGLQDPADLNDDLKNWAAKAKAEGKIKYFGFSTHKNMADCLMAASKLDWIDAIMPIYNYRLIQDPQLNAGIEACSKAGIALIAMKVQAYTAESEGEKAIHQRFIGKGFTDAQAKIKAVLQDERICCACVGMKNVATVTSNVAAILDKTELSKEDLNFLDSYAKQTCTGYCAACGQCDLAVPQMPYVSDVMRSMMYHNNYGDTALAKETFLQVASKVSSPISNFDYSRAEAVCPNRIAIADMMAKAEKLLA